jgi:hypothetical protein
MSLLATASRLFLAWLTLQLLKMKTRYYSKISSAFQRTTQLDIPEDRLLQVVMHFQTSGRSASLPASIRQMTWYSNHAGLPM